MEQKPIIEFKGIIGSIQLFENFVRLSKMGQRNDIYFKHITAIQIKKPGLLLGHLIFSFSGGGNMLFRGGDNIFFKKSCYEKALGIKEYIERANHSPTKSILSEANELEKLHNLMRKGVITQNEFELKKKKLFGT